MVVIAIVSLWLVSWHRFGVESSFVSEKELGNRRRGRPKSDRSIGQWLHAAEVVDQGRVVMSNLTQELSREKAIDLQRVLEDRPPDNLVTAWCSERPLVAVKSIRIDASHKISKGESTLRVECPLVDSLSLVVDCLVDKHFKHVVHVMTIHFLVELDEDAKDGETVVVHWDAVVIVRHALAKRSAMSSIVDEVQFGKVVLSVDSVFGSALKVSVAPVHVEGVKVVRPLEVTSVHLHVRVHVILIGHGESDGMPIVRHLPVSLHIISVELENSVTVVLKIVQVAKVKVSVSVVKVDGGSGLLCDAACTPMSAILRIGPLTRSRQTNQCRL